MQISISSEMRSKLFKGQKGLLNLCETRICLLLFFESVAWGYGNQSKRVPWSQGSAKITHESDELAK